MAPLAIIPGPVKIQIPKLPSGGVRGFIPYLSAHPDTPVEELLEPYKAYENELRKVYAQEPSHEVVKDPNVNLVPIFAGHEQELKIRARSLDEESDEEMSKYIMALGKDERKPSGAPAVVSSFKDFQQNFNLFSESSLADLDWSNVVAAGSSVTTAMLPIPEGRAHSKKSMREYYHEHLAPASDVDLFLYGLNEEEAMEKIEQIERCIQDSILHEVTTIRTKNAITIASQYPTRHVQIVLRLYDSISQIITGFDVDCACAAYDGKQVYAAPRAIAAFMTQCNTIDLNRRSPSYENRLSKYSRRGFEVYWPALDRTRIDPTIFERTFGRTQGLARLLILEKLPKAADRDSYMDKRRKERGRPAINRWRFNSRNSGNIKEQEEDDVAEWVEQEEVASYHTMTVPYGPKYHAANINRLLYAKDLLLNAEWNQPKDREVYLHRHPCFFGNAAEVMEDCCGYCPVPKTDEEIEVAEEESKTYLSGELRFLKDDPGRQEIGSFNPITDDEWTTMAYVGDTARLCQAISDGDLEHVEDWCGQEGVDVNCRDYTGRTPLHLATMTSTPEIVQCLIDNGARLTARLVDGRTALHIAAARGSTAMVAALMDKSLENEEEEDEKKEARHKAKRAERASKGRNTQDTEQEDVDMDDASSEASEITLDSDDDSDAMTMGSFVKVDKEHPKEDEVLEDSPDSPDVYDVDVIAWDHGLSPLHFAILNGHLDVIELLVSEYGSDVLIPVKLTDPYNNSPRAAIMTLVLTMSLPAEKAKQVAKLLLKLGATSAQGDMKRITALHYIVAGGNKDILNVLFSDDRPAALSVINNVGSSNEYFSQIAAPLITAIDKGDGDMVSTLLQAGAKPSIEFDDWVKTYLAVYRLAKHLNSEETKTRFHSQVTQLVVKAADNFMGSTVDELIKYGADKASCSPMTHLIIQDHQRGNYQRGEFLLDIIRKNLKELREYEEPYHHGQQKPEKLQDQEVYTRGIPEGTYQYFNALEDFRNQEQANKRAWGWYEESLKSNIQKGAKEKSAAIAEVIKELENTERLLIKAGAESFYEKYPKITKYNDNQRSYRYTPPEVKPYETSVTFIVPDLTDANKDRYLKLFEAAWVGDSDTVKAMTLTPFSNADGASSDAPLKIAVQDAKQFSPFSIAVLRGHFDLAKTIIEICMAQYHKDDSKTQRQRWSMQIHESEDEYSDEESEDEHILPIFSELISDDFTIDNLGEVSKAVKSDVLPLTMIEWRCYSQRFLDPADPNRGAFHAGGGVLEYAVAANDIKLLRFIIELGAEQKARLAEEHDDPRSYTIQPSAFMLAIQLGRTEMLAEMIKTTGVGIPLNALVEKSGVELKTKPKYYQGLSVGGKKRADWAQAPDDNVQVTEEKIPPLLRAAHLGSVESVEWFMSDAPLRRYKEFAEKNKNDKRIKVLDGAGKGFDSTIGSWLTTKSELVLHAAILHKVAKDETDKHLALIKHLISIAPEALEQKTIEGWTPLHQAVWLDREDLVAYFLSLGANQRQRDKRGRNMIHSMVTAKWETNSNPKTDIQKLQCMLELFDKEAVKAMLVERGTTDSGAYTPLASWMAMNTNYKKSDFMAVLSRYSSGEELEMINGEGELPLHVAVKQGFGDIISHLISLNPALLYRENTTGRTPLEMSNEIYLASCVENPPEIWNLHYNNQPIIRKSASSFVEEDDVVEQGKKRTWEICDAADKEYRKNTEEQNPKRRLVSLFEAKEVAERVKGYGSRYAGSQVVVNGGVVYAEEKPDPVGQWLRDM
ncbi:uncharacterized protein BP5553_03723 [Venustampulla echinocandica]|uniref:Ankyrin repeat protein n=1 Tax=Venustampulla echinocandica TaxID=2656787 RepID=A0A370TV15_9HELO|nr:uncharacterized protein BP5553_03723 [Venustampulla echinocandica]RDL39383.1 hypothetical protein BP5553_03723 [Venustampulla echinocandica]